MRRAVGVADRLPRLGNEPRPRLRSRSRRSRQLEELVLRADGRDALVREEGDAVGGRGIW